MEKFLSTPMVPLIGVPLKTFKGIWQFNLFNIAIGALFLLEIIIFIISQSSNNKGQNDKGSIYMVILGFVGSIWIDVYFIKNNFVFSKVKLPYESYIIGIILIIAGIIIRAIAVGTLRNNFTVEVNTSAKQELITKGIYRYVRNPAYTGSIVSLLGIAISLRCINAIIYSFILVILCYSYRIYIEEKALRNTFGKEFIEYCKKTKKLIPHIY